MLKLNPFYYNYYLVYILNNCKNSGIYSNFQKNLQPLNRNKFKSINQNQTNPQQNYLVNILGNSLTPNISKIKGLEFETTQEQRNKLKRIIKERQSRKSNRRSSYYQPNYQSDHQDQLPNTGEAFFQKAKKFQSQFNNNNEEESKEEEAIEFQYNQENRRFEKAMEIQQSIKNNKNKLFRKNRFY